MRAAVASHHSKSKTNLGQTQPLSFLKAFPKGHATSEGEILPLLFLSLVFWLFL